MQKLKLILGLLLALGSVNYSLKGDFEPSKAAFICDYHDVLVQPERKEKAIPAFREMSMGNKAKFLGRTIQYYFHKLVLSKIAPTNYPDRCYESFALKSQSAAKKATYYANNYFLHKLAPRKFPKLSYQSTQEDYEQDINYKTNAIRMMNSDTIVPENIEFLAAHKAAGAYIAICTNNGPVSTAHVNQENNNFLDTLCNNHDQDKQIALWTPNSQTGFIKKKYPQANSYKSLMLRIANARPETQEIVVIDDKQANLLAAQVALKELQAQEPPVLPQAKITTVQIKKPSEFVVTVNRVLSS